MSKRKAQRKVVTQKEKPKDHLPRRRYSLELLIILSLVISTLAAFGQVRNHEFLNCIPQLSEKLGCFLKSLVV